MTNKTPQRDIERERKERAREIIERLAALDKSKRQGGGVHGQVVGMEPWVIRATGDGLQCLHDAQALLDELLDPFDRRAAQATAAPVACPSCDGKGGWATAEWTDPISGPECEGERCGDCEGTGKVSADYQPLFAAPDRAPSADSADGWISVDDRLPSCDLLPNGDAPTAIAYWAPGVLADNLVQVSTVNTVYLNMHKEKFTHWMPLPPPPKATP